MNRCGMIGSMAGVGCRSKDVLCGFCNISIEKVFGAEKFKMVESPAADSS